jgi:putative sporulation protein YtaF
MHLLSIVLFVISSNLDNFVIAVAYGVKKLKIDFLSNLIFAFISCVGTFAAMTLGKVLCYFVSSRATSIIGSLILLLVGLWSIIDSFSKKEKDKAEGSIEAFSYNYLLENPDEVDKDSSGSIDYKESVLLGFALAVNNIGIGFGAGVTGLNILLTSILTFLVSFFAIILGYMLGQKCLSGFMGKWGGLISGLIIIFIGIYEFF